MKKTVIVQEGTSVLNITIPKNMCEKLDIKKGDTLLLETIENNSIKITK